MVIRYEKYHSQLSSIICETLLTVSTVKKIKVKIDTVNEQQLLTELVYFYCRIIYAVVYAACKTKVLSYCTIYVQKLRKQHLHKYDGLSHINK